MHVYIHYVYICTYIYNTTVRSRHLRAAERKNSQKSALQSLCTVHAVAS